MSLSGFLSQSLQVALTVLGEVIETVGSGTSREDLHTQLRVERARTARAEQDRDDQLVIIADLERTRDTLENRVDRLRFNGPSLYSDEVDAINAAVQNLSDDVYATESKRARLKSLRKTLRMLIERCDVFPFTRQDMVDGIQKSIAAIQPDAVVQEIPSPDFCMHPDFMYDAKCCASPHHCIKCKQCFAKKK